MKSSQRIREAQKSLISELFDSSTDHAVASLQNPEALNSTAVLK